MPKTSGHAASARPGLARPGPSGHVIERIRWVECIKQAGVDRWDLDRLGRCIYDWPCSWAAAGVQYLPHISGLLVDRYSKR